MPTRGAQVRITKSLPSAVNSLPTKAEAKSTIFILSDVRLYREALAWNLQRDGALNVLGEATPSESTLACLISLSPDAIVLDMAVPDALGVARTLRARIPHTKIVAFAVSNVDAEIVTCARAGICGYVHRDGSAADLVTEVLNAVRGELHCSPRMAALLQEQVEYLSRGDLGVNMLNCQPAGMLQSLTERERDILRHVDKGMSNKEIARALKISLATVKNHVHNILEKLQVRRRTEALAYVREQQISPVPRIAG